MSLESTSEELAAVQKTALTMSNNKACKQGRFAELIKQLSEFEDQNGLIATFRFMKGVESLDQFREALKRMHHTSEPSAPREDQEEGWSQDHDSGVTRINTVTSNQNQ